MQFIRKPKRDILTEIIALATKTRPHRTRQLFAPEFRCAWDSTANFGASITLDPTRPTSWRGHRVNLLRFAQTILIHK